MQSSAILIGAHKALGFGD